MSPETIYRLNELRQKSLAQTITDDELREAIRILREDRLATPQRVSKAPTVVSTEDLF